MITEEERTTQYRTSDAPLTSTQKDENIKQLSSADSKKKVHLKLEFPVPKLVKWMASD